MVPMAMLVQEILVPGGHAPTAREGIERAGKCSGGHDGERVEGKKAETHMKRQQMN